MAIAVTHGTNALKAATDAVTGQLGANSKLVFRASPSSVGTPGTMVAICPLETSASPFNAANSSGIASAKAITADSSATAGTIAYATLEGASSTVVVHCDVGASASSINLTNGLVVSSGDTVSVSSLTYQAITA